MFVMLRLVMLLILCQAASAGDRPRIGLVLSGGGARGAAHIGVLKFLEENRIPVDVITGTSMGAIVGGLYASGLGAAEIEKIMVEMDWVNKLDDEVPRDQRAGQRKRIEEMFSIPAAPGFTGKELKLPTGAIQGQHIMLELQRITRHVSRVESFDDLPIPFRAVATDIVTGKAVILDHGDLATAMRASMGVPAIFAPIQVEGQLLVDGGVSRNLPVAEARELGAEVLIVVDISAPLLDEDHITDLLSVTDQLTRMLIVNNSLPQIAALGPRDVMIVPPLGDFSSLAFDRATEGIDIGYGAASQASGRLLRLSDPEWRQPRSAPPENPLIRRITLDNDSGLDDRVISQMLDERAGDVLQVEKLEKELGEIHGLGHFERVAYHLQPVADGKVDMRLIARSKSWGPDYLRFGIDMRSEFENDARTTFLVGYTRGELSDKGAEWTSVAGIGSEPVLATMWYQPLTWRRGWYLAASASWRDELFSDFVGERKRSEFGLRRARAYVGLGYELGTTGTVSLGMQRINGRADVSVADPAITDIVFDDAGLALSFTHDTRDSPDFPSTGSLVKLDWQVSRKSLGSDTNYRQWTFEGHRYHEWGRNNLGLAVLMGATRGQGNIGSVYRLGGFGRISGLRTDQIRGDYMGVISATYYRRYQGIPVLDGFAGLILEYGGAWQHREDIRSENAVFSAGAFLAAESPVGILQLGVARTSEGNTTFFSRIGRPL